MMINAINNNNSNNGYGSIDPSSLGELEEQDHNNSGTGSERTPRSLLVAGLAYCTLLVIAIRINSTGGGSANNRAFEFAALATTTTTESPVLAIATTTATATATVKNDPTKAMFFEQIVDHNLPETSGTYQQRYFENLNHWKGPGHPIFMVIGGEDEISGISYPFISEILAEKYDAYAFEPEHRYYGASYPLKNYTKQHIAAQMTPKQAVQDAVRMVQFKQQQLGCGPRGTPTYCPVMAVGGSYSGLLATLARMSYPDVIDVGYGGGSCLKLYDHSTDPYEYYEYITDVAERLFPGCPKAVEEALAEVQSDFKSLSSKDDITAMAQEYGICPNIPNKIKSGSDMFHAVSKFVSNSFGENNMFYYPPSPDKKFARGCAIFKNHTQPVKERIHSYFQAMTGTSGCHDIHPTADDGSEEDLWGALCCYLVPMIGKSNRTMFPPKKYSLEEDIRSCKKDYDIDLDVDYMNKEFNLREGWARNKRLLLTNGLNDGWYSVSYDNSPPGSEVHIMNFETGAHHSELMHTLDLIDTPEIASAHKKIADLVGKWLDEVRAEGSIK